MQASPIQFGKIVIDNDSFDRRFGQTAQRTQWADLWRHTENTVRREYQTLEQLTDMDVYVSAVDKKRYQVVLIDRKSDQRIPVQHMESQGKLPGIFEIRLKSRSTGQFIEGSIFLEPLRNDFGGLKWYLLDYATKLQRPLNSNWPIGKPLAAMLSTIPYDIRRKWFLDIQHQVKQQGDSVDLSFLPLYKKAKLPNPIFALTAVESQIVAEAKATDWLQGLWLSFSAHDRLRILEGVL